MTTTKQLAEELLTFIEKSPTAFHTVQTMKEELLAAGYTELQESEERELQPGGRYFVTRGGSALIAFRIPSKSVDSFRVIASHSDSPMLKIKENPEIGVENHYVKLNVEKYGGMLCAPWFDRPLSVAGRLVIKTESGIETRLVNAARPMLMLPSLAIHMNREANNGMAIHVQEDMLPLYGDQMEEGTFMGKIADLAGVKESDIISYDLYVCGCTKGIIWGNNDEFLSSGRLDDLECAFASLRGFLFEKEEEVRDGLVPVHCVFDNEEVGSQSRQGAGASFLKDTLERIAEALKISPSEYRRILARSFMISADNAHAVHPAYPGKACPTNRVYLNEGIAVKFNANMKYTTDGISAGIFRRICEIAGVKTQTFFNHSDIPGGSTLGCISLGEVAINTVDIGLPQLAMHSIYETAGTKDLKDLVSVIKQFFRTEITMGAEGNYCIR